MLACRNGTWGRTGGRALARARARHAFARARAWGGACASLKKQSANNKRTKNKQQTANNKRTKNKVSGRFRDSFGCPRPNIRPRKTKDLCAICESSWASDFKHNSDLQAYHRGALPSRPALPAYPRGALRLASVPPRRLALGTVSGRFRSGEVSGRFSGRFWVPKAEYSPEENQRSVRYLREHLGIKSNSLQQRQGVASNNWR